FLITIFLVPVIYILGHIIGSFSYNLLNLFVWIDKTYKRNEKEMSKFKYWTLIKFQQLLYRQRVLYAVVKYQKSNGDSPFKNHKEFWTLCAKLQKLNHYTPAEYWYVLNELFNSVNLIFFIS